MASNDPRAPELEEPFRVPKSYTESMDAVTSFSMLMAGATLLTRNLYGAWLALFASVSGFMNQHPMRTKEGGQTWSALVFSIGALVTVYMPRMIIQPVAQAAKPS